MGPSGGIGVTGGRIGWRSNGLGNGRAPSIPAAPAMPIACMRWKCSLMNSRRKSPRCGGRGKALWGGCRAGWVGKWCRSPMGIRNKNGDGGDIISMAEGGVVFRRNGGTPLPGIEMGVRELCEEAGDTDDICPGSGSSFSSPDSRFTLLFMLSACPFSATRAGNIRAGGENFSGLEL